MKYNKEIVGISRSDFIKETVRRHIPDAMEKLIPYATGELQYKMTRHVHRMKNATLSGSGDWIIFVKLASKIAEECKTSNELILNPKSTMILKYVLGAIQSGLDIDRNWSDDYKIFRKM